jgi:hypothetical protein
MLKARAWTAVVAVGLVVAGCGGLGGNELSAEGDWEEFGVDGLFSAEFPGEPEEQDVGASGDGWGVIGGGFEVGVASSELDGLPDDITAEQAEPVLVGAAEGAAGGVGGAVVETSTVADSPYPAMDVEFTGTRDGDDIVGFGRTMLAEGQLFMLMAIGPVDDRAETEALFDRFVDGFEPVAG